MNSIENIETRSKNWAYISLFGLIVILIGFVYAFTKLRGIDREIELKNIELNQKNVEINKLEIELRSIGDTLDIRNRDIEMLFKSRSVLDKGISSYYAGNYIEALNHYNDAIIENRKNSTAYALKSRVLIRLDSLEKSQEMVDISLLLDPLNQQALYTSVLLSVKNDNMDSAFDYLGQLLRVVPSYIRDVELSTELLLLSSSERFQKIKAEEIRKLTFVQRVLKTMGYYNNEVDGILGEQTLSAISNFQRDNGIVVTGNYDLETTKLLFDLYLEKYGKETADKLSYKPYEDN